MIKKKHRSESFESLFKRFKKNVEKKDTINEVRKREHYIKPSAKKKLARDMAVKKEQKRQGDMRLNRTPGR
jgi:small subunit ribosomal protein S21